MVLHFIPANLDIERLIQICPPIEVAPFCKDKLIHILHCVHAVPAQNKDIAVINGFVPLYSRILKRRVHNYCQYLAYLCRVGVLQTDNWYVVGEKSKGYRFAPQYQTNLKAVVIQDRTLRRQLKAEGNFSEAMRKRYAHLIQWYTPELGIDYDLAMDFVLRDLKRKQADASLLDYDLCHQKPKDPYNQFTSACINIERIAAGEFLVNVDSNVFRLHSTITNLRSEIRHCLSYRGTPLVSIDIKNSQPYLSTVLLSEGFWARPIASKHINIQHISNSVSLLSHHNKEPYNSYIMCLKSSVMQAGPDLQRFIGLVTEGGFYEYLAEAMESELGVSFATRKQVKGVVFMVLFTDNRYLALEEAAPKRLFKAHFPSVYEVFSVLKRGDKTRLPRLLQRIESHLMLNVITKRIARERPNLPIFTIHDSIVTTVGNEAYVTQVMEEELLRATGYLPSLSIEPWEPQRMKFNDNQLFIGEERLVA